MFFVFFHLFWGVFVGMMAFEMMHALGLPVPLNFLDPCATKDSLKIIQIAHSRNIPVLFPEDFWCINDHLPKRLELFPAHGILDGELYSVVFANITLSNFFHGT